MSERSTRVAELLREELSSMVTTELSDPRVAGVVVTSVDLTRDLRVAKVRYRLMTGADDEKTRKAAQEGLVRASGLLRREATNRLSLHSAPELIFTYDAGQDARHRVESLLHEIAEENKKKG
ncbi:MAG: 30S ribosome-binding factor RbfA [Polyangiaceae bacterium]